MQQLSVKVRVARWAACQHVPGFHMAYKFEKRAYGPDCTPQELLAMKECVYLYEPGVFYWRELPVQSPYQLNIFDQRLHELSQGLERYNLIIDLVEATPPNAEV